MIIGKSTNNKECNLLPEMANRHGLISGVTGSGKTVTLRVMAEKFAEIGVPVFLADIKGDLSGVVLPGEPDKKIESRIKSLNLSDFQYRGYATLFFDLYGQLGHPIQTTCTQLGDLLLARLLDLNAVQTGILTLGYQLCIDRNLFCEDLKDVKVLLKYLADHAYDFKTQYGNITYSSVGAIQRGILGLQKQGVDQFFRRPIFDIENFFHVDKDNYGVINILQADTLIKSPKLYCTFLLWLLAELYEKLPEVGDIDKPKLVFFFDEAHLLFSNIPKILLEKVEQIIRLIRSKGVGVFFVTQNALDIPETVLGQLGNRVQHALRAFTPKDKRAIKAISETFRENPNFKTAKAIMELKIGEALISFLEENGDPSPVERCMILPPKSRLKPLTANEIIEVVRSSPIYGVYEREEKKEPESPMVIDEGTATDKLLHDLGRGMVKTMGGQIGRQIVRGIFNSFFRGGRSALGL